MRAILCFVVFLNILRVACIPIPVDLEWSDAADYHGGSDPAPKDKYGDNSQEVQNIKNAHTIGNQYIDSMEKVVNDHEHPDHKKILVHNFGEHYDIEKIKEGVANLKNGKIGVKHVHKEGVTGKASMTTSGPSKGLVTFKGGFHKLKDDHDRAGTFIHEATHSLVGTLDRYRVDPTTKHLVPITKKEQDSLPKGEKVVTGYLKDKKIHELLNDPNMKTQMHKNADSWKAFGHHAFHGEAHPLHPMKADTVAGPSINKAEKRPHPDDDSDGGSPHGNKKLKPLPKSSGGSSSKSASTTKGKTASSKGRSSKAGSSTTRQKKSIQSSQLQKSTGKQSSQKKSFPVRKTASSRPSLAKSRLGKQSSPTSKSTAKHTVSSSKKMVKIPKTAARSKSGAKPVQKGSSKVRKPLSPTRKQAPVVTRQKSKAAATSSKQKKAPSSKTPRLTPKPSSRKAVAASKIKQAVGAGTKRTQKASPKVASRPKPAVRAKAKTPVPHKAPRPAQKGRK